MDTVMHAAESPFFVMRPLALAMLALATTSTWAEDEGKVSVLADVVVRESIGVDPAGMNRKSLTGSRLGLSVKDTPASVTVIDRDLIEARGAENTQEIIKGIPGVTSSSAPGSPGQVFYRGFTSGSVTQLFNGITVQYDVIAARPVDSWIYDRVEAIGGPSSFLFGAGAVGGSINYVTKLASREGNFSEARLGAGSYNALQMAAGTNQKLGASNVLRLDISRNTGGAWSDRTEREAMQLAGSWLTDLAPGLSHTLALEYQKETVDRPYWGTPVLKPIGGRIAIDEGTRFKNYNSNDGLYEQTVRWARSIIDYRLSDKLSLRNTFYHYDALRDYRNVEVYEFNANNTLVSRKEALLQRHDQSLNGNRLEFSLDQPLGALKSNWAGGVDFSVNKQTRFPRSVAGPFGNVDPYAFSTENFFSLPGMTPGFTPNRTNEVTTLAAFLENRTFLTSNLSLLTGLRQERIDLEVTNHQAVTATNPAYFSRRYTPLTGRVALNYDFTPNASAYVQYSTAADPPAGILTTATFGQVKDFELTTGKQVEAGSKWFFDERKGTATFAVYEITRNNFAVANPSQPGTTVPVGQQTSRGVELTGSYRFVPGVQIAGNYGFVNARYDEFTENVGGTAVSRAGYQPSNTPRQVGNLWLTWSPTASLQVGGDVRHVGSRFADSANTISEGSYNLLGAFAAYKLDRSTTLTLRARNLTDQIYSEFLSGTGNMAYLGAPRTFDLSIHARF
ncbi:TonB-dependent receptor [Dechloromonas sp. TW-R-39-2]|uniref:TonB-dependent receptor n=1 Tax=Dechloromonas sp. TW-R-39-2 TaxID=2654218 RepID=UPI00193EC078|nr:TonB-dependent receptor [Dechloromonas sp. TW-R-39-2]QRM20815.1 TonB-dependent receptor [Dechloromonas sp. TW-R-39-2]